MYTNLPTLGVGLGWRKEIAHDIFQHKANIDWCEVITEHYINVTPEKLNQLEKLAETFPIVPHGIDLSIGTDLSVEENYFTELKKVLQKTNAPWFTDHLCFTRVPTASIGQLTPLQFSEEVVDIVVNKVRTVKEQTMRPFLLENITYYFKIPGSELSESEFLTRILNDADIGLLLDVCNLYMNSQNLGYDPYQFLHSIPLERTVQLHLAGGIHDGQKWLDTHSRPVHKEIFKLTEYILAIAPVKGILLERDDDFPASFNDIVDELNYAREIFKRHHHITTNHT